MKMTSLMGRLVLAVTLSIGMASVAEARAGHNQPGPEVFDAGRPVSRTAASSSKECYIEPKGFRSQIRWDGACVAAGAKPHEVTHDTAEVEPNCYQEPLGFRQQIRWFEGCAALRAPRAGR